ncbi:MAG: helix-turn-helix domain containing protein [Aestuariivita sp.]|nr:helix-turn-helix domain containing protein [Aestuariivita sp.]
MSKHTLEKKINYRWVLRLSQQRKKSRERLMQRRAEPIKVATQLFLENGFHNTSIREIVRAFSFNLASFYMYVSSKEDIFFLVA